MKRVVVVLVAVLVVSLSLSEALAQSEPEKLIEEAKDLFARKKWARALTKFKLALQMGAKGEGGLEIALHTGAIYAEVGQNELAQQNFGKYLAEHPTTEAPATFTGTMTTALEEVRAQFPIVSDISLEEESFKPYREKTGITFTIKAAESILEKTKVSLRILPESRTNIVFEAPVTVNVSAPIQEVLWDGRDKYAMFLRNGDYIFVVRAVREDGWEYTCEYVVEIGGNLETPKVMGFRKKARRIEVLSGQRQLDCIPGKPLVKIGEKPLKGSVKGLWNYVYYISIGAIRDVLDFPVKFLLTLPGLGHALTVTAPFGGGYLFGQSLWQINKNDYYYYDPMAGSRFDKDSYNNDKKVIEQRSLASAGAGPLWALAYAGVMSVISWAGTEDGIAKGFTSYRKSNALSEGYKSKYFFPNYRSLDFTIVREDKEALARLEEEVRRRNEGIMHELNSINQRIDKFNGKKMWPFKRSIADRFKKELYDLAVMTLKGKK